MFQLQNVGRELVRLSQVVVWLCACLVLVPRDVHGQGESQRLEPLALPASATVHCDSLSSDAGGGSRRYTRTFTISNGGAFDERTVKVIYDSAGKPGVLGDMTATHADGTPTMTIVTVIFARDSVTGTRQTYRTAAPTGSRTDIPEVQGITLPISSTERESAAVLAAWLATRTCAVEKEVFE